MSLLCLTMIVKNEASVIARCLEAAKPFVDSYAIVDTGSTDDTAAIIRRVMNGVPGQVQFREWSGFGDAKTAAVDLAREVAGKQAYALVVDADEVLEGERPQDLSFDAYGVWLLSRNRCVRNKNVRLLSLAKPWRFAGVVHERPITAPPYTEAMIDSFVITSPRDGARSRDSQRFVKDAQAIQEAMAALPEAPEDALDPYAVWRSRYQFYLAQSHRDAGQDEAAVGAYRQRAIMGVGSNPEEVYIAHLEIARALDRLGYPVEADYAYLDAHHAFPERWEALRELAARTTARLKGFVDSPPGSLFVETPLPHPVRRT